MRTDPLELLDCSACRRVSRTEVLDQELPRYAEALERLGQRFTRV